MDDCSIINKRVQSAAKFSELDWSSPIKGDNPGDIINYQNDSQGNIFAQDLPVQRLNSHNFMKTNVTNKNHPFTKSLKYKNLNKKISEIVSNSPGRKKSVQSYNNINSNLAEKEKVNTSDSYKSNRHNFYRRDCHSNNSSRTKLVPCKTPNLTKNPPYNSSKRTAYFEYDKRKPTWKNSQRKPEPKKQNGKTSMLIDF